jgi:hypothetical protein
VAWWVQGHIEQLKPQVMHLHHEHASLQEATAALRAKLHDAQHLKVQQEQHSRDTQAEIRSLSNLGEGAAAGGAGRVNDTSSCGGMMWGEHQEHHSGGGEQGDKGKMPMIV